MLVGLAVLDLGALLILLDSICGVSDLIWVLVLCVVLFNLFDAVWLVVV